ncbi:MAG: hypothetical protein RMK18_08800 [Armatimonadota bacterium]|nr:hypothetical protein [Armatimonadota bacterium]MDW8025940.1 hypothetical protein [Armatimonadota bacterium]
MRIVDCSLLTRYSFTIVYISTTIIFGFGDLREAKLSIVKEVMRGSTMSEHKWC